MVNCMEDTNLNIISSASSLFLRVQKKIEEQLQ